MFRVGVNYWPARQGMRMWERPDLPAVTDDLERIAAAGFDSVRVFLRWEDAQPEPDRVSADALRALVGVADAAQRARLALVPTLFCGHMSGANWIPRWALAPGAPRRFRTISRGRAVEASAASWYEDEEVQRAQAALARACAEALAGHPALWLWDLGNENSNVCVPRTREQGIAWLERMAGAIRRADPAAKLTIGLHMEDLEEDRRLGPAEAARVCDVLSMHGYPMYAAFARDALDERLLPFLARLTRWLGGKEVLFEEYGVSTERVGEDDAAAYCARGADALRGAACGALLWCYADYDRSLWGEPPFDLATHERHFGLWRADGRPKPAVAALAAVPRERAPAGADLGWIDVPREEYYRDPAGNLRRLYAAYTARAPS